MITYKCLVSFVIMRVAIYPGSFDPITYGHMDIIDRASGLFDKIIIAVAKSEAKNPLFTLEDRMKLAKTIYGDNDKVDIVGFPRQLTVDVAKEHNALFGEWTYNQNEGVVPLEREIGETHLIKSFSSYDNSVSSYFKNINSHYAYKDFREVRNYMRLKNNFSDVNLLIDNLNYQGKSAIKT